MQFTTLTAVTALAAAVSAARNGTVVYTTDVYTAYTTVCPASTEISFNGITYTATESTTLTITNCPCTVVKPITSSSLPYYNSRCFLSTLFSNQATDPVTSSASSSPVWHNGTATATGSTKSTAVGTTSSQSTASSAPTSISSSGANKLALSGASVAAVLGFAAYFL